MCGLSQNPYASLYTSPYSIKDPNPQITAQEGSLAQAAPSAFLPTAAVQTREVNQPTTATNTKTGGLVSYNAPEFGIIDQSAIQSPEQATMDQLETYEVGAPSQWPYGTPPEMWVKNGAQQAATPTKTLGVRDYASTAMQPMTISTTKKQGMAETDPQKALQVSDALGSILTGIAGLAIGATTKPVTLGGK